MGFEPMTSCLLDRRSNQLSYGASVNQTRFNFVPKCGKKAIKSMIMHGQLLITGIDIHDRIDCLKVSVITN